MNNIKYTLFYNWHFARVLRLALGAFVAYQAIVMHDAFSGLLAIFLLFQAATNTGCCGAQGCAPVNPKNNQNKTEDISYQEIK